MRALRERRRLQNAIQQSQRTPSKITERPDEFLQQNGRSSEIYPAEYKLKL